MSESINSLIECGTKLWLDSIDPELVAKNIKLGVTGATSNPIIIADLIKTGRFDNRIAELLGESDQDEEVAWILTDEIVSSAEKEFLCDFETTFGDDGYVSFELDPLLEDTQLDLEHDVRVKQYVESGIKWNEGHRNRMIKVPATRAGIDSLEELVAAGISVNVTLIFTQQQYEEARDSVWRGAQRRESLEMFKSVYSIFVSRIDVYTEKHCPGLSAEAQGQVGIVNAKRIWKENQEFWNSKKCPLNQEIIFASTGTKKPDDLPWKYVAALAGSDIQTNPPATNDAVAGSSVLFENNLVIVPSPVLVSEIDHVVDFNHLFETLMAEGVSKFAEPQKALLALIGQRRKSLAGTCRADA